MLKKCSRFALVAMGCLGLLGCEGLAYYGHAISGQLSLLNSREPIDKILENSDTNAGLAERLKLVQEVRTFAEEELLLPVGKAYSSYSDIKRPYAVWNVYAAPKYQLASYTWCHPFVGCMGYKGYFKEEKAQKEANKLKEKNLDVKVGGVLAYSTLGLFSDPVLNTFVLKNESYLVDLLIHEIAHRKLYIKNDTRFNESFATAVANIGAERWYAQQGNAQAYTRFQRSKARRAEVKDFLMQYRERLQSLYSERELTDSEKETQKTKIFASLHEEYRELKVEQGWGDAMDNWIYNLNNADFATLANYNDLVPHFIKLHENVGGDWPRFYEKVEDISKLEKAERNQFLESLL